MPIFDLKNMILTYCNAKVWTLSFFFISKTESRWIYILIILNYDQFQNLSIQPSNHPTIQSSNHPTNHPSIHPSNHPTIQPSNHPTIQPSNHPTIQPSNHPTIQLSNYPPFHPSNHQTIVDPHPNYLYLPPGFRSGTEASKRYISCAETFMLDTYLCLSFVLQRW